MTLYRENYSYLFKKEKAIHRGEETSYFSELFIFFIFLPSITFGLLRAEVFPWGMFFLFLGPYKYNKNVILLFFIFSLSGLFTYMIGDTTLGQLIRSLMAYINIFLIVNYLIVSSERIVYKSAKTVYFLFFFLFVFGLFQHFKLLGPLGEVLRLLIPRGEAEALEAGGRGVTLLSSEPSRAGAEYVYFYALIRPCLKKKYALSMDLLGLVYQALIIRSATALMIYFVFLMFVFRKRIYIAAILIAIVFYFALQWEGVNQIRAFIVLRDIMKTTSISELYFLLLQASGFRVISVIGAFIFGFRRPLGGGVGGWEKSSLQSLQMTGYTADEISFFRIHSNSIYVPIRPTSFFANIMLDLGALGSVFLIGIIRLLFRNKLYFNKDTLPIMFLFWVTILFYGTAGNPIIWAVTIIAGRIGYEQRKMQNSKGEVIR